MNYYWTKIPFLEVSLYSLFSTSLSLHGSLNQAFQQAYFQTPSWICLSLDCSHLKPRIFNGVNKLCSTSITRWLNALFSLVLLWWRAFGDPSFGGANRLKPLSLNSICSFWQWTSFWEVVPPKISETTGRKTMKFLPDPDVKLSEEARNQKKFLT